MWLKIAGALLVMALLSGCVGEEEGVGTDDEVNGAELGQAAYRDIEFPWGVNGEFTLVAEVFHPGGPLNARLLNQDGLLTTFQVASPEDCEGALGGGALTVGGGSNQFAISCPDVEEGPVTMEISLTGVTSGVLIIEGVQEIES